MKHVNDQKYLPEEYMYRVTKKCSHVDCSQL